MMNFPRRLCACLLSMVACAKSDESASAGETTIATTMTETSTTDDCTPGYESCECVGGEVCLAGLACVSKVCVNLGELTTGGDSAGDSSGKGTEGPPMEGNCTASWECADNEVCVDGFCGDTDLYYFDVRVESFAPNDCSDGWGAGEVYFAFYTTPDSLQAVSGEAYCPASWSDFMMPAYDSLVPFRLDFWESDVVEDDYLATLCWDGEGVATTFDNCQAVPKHWLHEGTVTGYIGNDIGVTVNFTAFSWP